MTAPSFLSLQRKQRIYEQWCRFHRGEEVDVEVVQDFILRSWMRCREARVDAFQPVQKRVTREVLAEEIQAHAELVESARTIMDNVFNTITGSRSTMVLAMAKGVVLRVLPRDGGVALVGSVAREAYTGTAGIATCLEERRPVEIFAAEHYCAANHNFVCSAAPVFDRRGDLVGAIGVTSHCDSFHPHTSGMIGAAAQAIIEQLRLRDLLGEQGALLELLDEGVIMLDGKGEICAINRKATAMLGVSAAMADVAGHSVDDFLQFSANVATLMASDAPFHDEDTTVQLADRSLACVLSAAVNPITGGRVLTLRETGRMREFATRITGAKATYRFDDILGKSAPLREAVRQARRAAASDITTLVLGESGTGKELFAQSIHNAGARSGKPFIVVNCGALPRELVQSELFGYTEGAFTGASRQGKPGKFELADGGTLFLDEIGDMPLDAQVSLLRLLQNGEVTRVGGKRTRLVNVRVLAATNRDLVEAVRQNSFREDLYYRLNVFTLNVPSLRERGPEDVRELAIAFLAKFSQALGNPVTGMTDDVWDKMCRYPWPGNIRELENAMERAVHMAAGPKIREADLPAAVVLWPDVDTRRTAEAPKNGTGGASEEGCSLREGEAAALVAALAAQHGHVRRTAKILGISRSTLYYKLNRLGLDPNLFRAGAYASPVLCPPTGQKKIPSPHEVEALVDGLSSLDGRQLDVLVRMLKTCRL